MIMFIIMILLQSGVYAFPDIAAQNLAGIDTKISSFFTFDPVHLRSWAIRLVA